MQHWARQMCQQILRRGNAEKQVVAFVEWEVDVTEIGFYDLAAVTGFDAAKVWRGEVGEAERQRLRVAAMKRAALPIWLIGHSRKRRREFDRLTMDLVHEALCQGRDCYGVRVIAVFLDFLQAVDPIPGMERRLQIMADTDRARQIGRDLGCPVIVGSQAGRKVDDLAFKLPRMGDNEESSRIEQNADKVLALWWPWRTEPMGKLITEIDEYVTQELFVIGIRKQRFGPPGDVVKVRFDAPRNTFSSWSLQPAQEPVQHWTEKGQ
jgi:replicative DNA helicase